MSRISIEVTPEEHNAIKAMALMAGTNIRGFVMHRLFGDEGALSKKAHTRLMAAVKESVDKKRTLKSYKTAKELFDEYR